MHAVEMKAKNIEFIRMAVSLAHSEANHLGGAWHPVLHVISQVRCCVCCACWLRDAITVLCVVLCLLATRLCDYASPIDWPQVAKQQVLASGAKADEAFFPQSHPALASTDRHQRAKLLAVETVRRANAVLVASAVDEVTVDRIFNRSVSLSSDAVVDFVTQLCRVSEQVPASPAGWS